MGRDEDRQETREGRSRFRRAAQTARTASRSNAFLERADARSISDVSFDLEARDSHSLVEPRLQPRLIRGPSRSWFRCAMASAWRPMCICRKLRARRRSLFGSPTTSAGDTRSSGFGGSRSLIVATYSLYRIVRGKFRSEGETVPYLNEVADGYDTLDWIAGQSWSTA